MADSKENYKFYQGVKGLTQTGKEHTHLKPLLR